MAPYRLNASLSPELAAKMRKYIYLKWGEEEGFYGKTSEVVRMALRHFLDEELEKLEGERQE